MATENLQIPDIQANQNQKEVTANAAHNLLDRAQNNIAQKTISGSTTFTTTETRENFVVEFVGTPGAAFTVDMPDTNRRLLAVVNNADDQGTIRNSVGAGAGQPVVAVGEASIFHYDGTDFIDLSALALAVATFLGLTDTPGSFAGESGKVATVDVAEAALEFVSTSSKAVRAASTANGALATDFEDSDVMDGVTLATGDRILLKNQTNGEENGIYTVNATGAPTRAADFDDAADIQGIPALIPVLEGTANGQTVWLHTTTGAIIIDTTALTFVNVADTDAFTGLTDTPAGYTDNSGKAVRVNEAEDALEFVGTDIKIPVAVATTANGTLASDFENGDTVDGVTLATGDRILIKNQSTASENGIYVVEATGAPTRAIDLDDDEDAIPGLVVAVNEGTANAQTMWQMTNTTQPMVGTDNITFAQVGGGDSRTLATLQTTDATVTDIFTEAIAAGESITVRGFGVAQGPSNASVGFDFVITAHNNGGTTTYDGGQIRHNDTNTNGWTVTADADDTGDTIRLRANGAGATTIDWRVEYEITVEA